MVNQKLLITLGMMTPFVWCGDIAAQTESGRPAHALMYLQPTAGQTTVPFDWNDVGTEFQVRWGMDTAWDDEGNVRRGTNYIGTQNMATGRISFQTSDLVDAEGNLSDAQKEALDSRISHIKLSGTKSVELNCDHEALNATNYKGKPTEWYKVIKATVKYAQSKGLTVESIAPFNEPDYTSWNEGTKADFLNICKLIKADDELAGIRLCGGNTLNCDEALSWYNYLKGYLDEGNTHQLAGSFDNYANFFKTVKGDGKVATADELHNVGEAIVGVEYGMENGIWWSFDGVARGEFCKANMAGGSRLGYAEDRDSWTAAAVYRQPSGRVDGYIGSSERQANTHSYDFVSKGRDVYYDGYGPMRAFSVSMPGGTGYQNGQTNAERLVQITSGEDVQPYPLASGAYVIINSSTKKALYVPGKTVTAGATVALTSYSKTATGQQWLIEPVNERIGGDFSYVTIRSMTDNSMYLDLLNWSTVAYGTLCAYNGDVGSNEQWFFEYAGNGDYYIRSRHSGLYLQTNSSASVFQNRLVDAQSNATTNKLFRWRILPVNTAWNITVPAAPQGLVAEAQSASVLLSWNANKETDLDGYIVLRANADEETPQWQVVGRQVSDTTFVDNSCKIGGKYLYKVKAYDHCCNISKQASSEVSVELPDNHALVAWYDMEDSPRDTTSNLMDAVAGGTVQYSSSSKKLGEKSLLLNGTNAFLQLPAQVADFEEMTIATWVNWQNTSSSWTRIFDFGNGTDEYMFLCPKNNGSKMRFVIKSDGEEHVLEAAKLTSGWHHVAVTLGEDGVFLYVDGVQTGISDMACRPSQIQPSRCYIGRSQFAADPLFKGNIDDFRIYNYALSSEDIALIMGGAQPTAISTPTTSVVQKEKKEIYSLGGARRPSLGNGVNIVKTTHADGTVSVRKSVVRK